MFRPRVVWIEEDSRVPFGTMLSVAMALLAAGQPAASPPSAGATLNRWGPATCAANSAQPSTIQAIAADPLRMRGRCVAVEGYWRGRALFLTPSEGEQDHSNLSAALERRRVGLYATDQVSAAGSKLRKRVLVIGTVDDCAAAWEAEGEPIMVLGYCHTAHGAFLAVSDVQAK